MPFDSPDSPRLPGRAPDAIDGPWILTASGRCYPTLAPTPADVHFPDIAEGLAKRARLAGQAAGLYSVAQHSIVVERIVGEATRGVSNDLRRNEMRIAALLHDAHEFVLGDLPTPAKHALRALDPAALAAWDALSAIHDRAIFAAAGIAAEPAEDVRLVVKHADMAALATERRDIMPDGPWDLALPDPAPWRIEPWTWGVAMERFLARLEELTGTSFRAPLVVPVAPGDLQWP